VALVLAVCMLNFILRNQSNTVQADFADFERKQQNSHKEVPKGWETLNVIFIHYMPCLKENHAQIYFFVVFNILMNGTIINTLL
jgi:hypothetical protein